MQTLVFVYDDKNHNIFKKRETYAIKCMYLWKNR